MRAKIHDEFTELTVSKQRKWQLRRERDLKCRICGKPVNLYAKRCDKCSVETSKYLPWRSGGRGRPPHCVKSGRVTAEAFEAATLKI